jgi:hypothetical protein
MKQPRLFVLAVLLYALLSYSAAAQKADKVEYLADSVAEKDDNYLRLLGGSVWILSRPSLTLVTDEVIIVFHAVQLAHGKTSTLAVAYMDGDEIPVTLAKGQVATQTGVLTTVVEALSDGAVLRLADGSLLCVPKYDQFDTGWWLPPYKALVTGNGLYLYNLKKGKRVWVKLIK